MSNFTITESYSVLDNAQCAQVIRQLGELLVPSMVGSEDKRVQSPARTCSSIKLGPGALPPDVTNALWRATSPFVVGKQEPWELVRYRVGEFYKPHTDGSHRTHSAIVYLNTPEAGGATVFVKVYHAISPRRGKLVCWNNVPMSLHESSPVIAGEKWILATWWRA